MRALGYGLLVVLALLAAACASSIERAVPAGPRLLEVSNEIEVDVAELGPFEAGTTSPQVVFPVRVEIAEALLEDPRGVRLYAVVAHELLHALGWEGHVAGPESYLSHGGRHDNGPPSAADLALLERVEGVRTVRVLDDQLRPAVTWACSLWNHYGGRRVFELAPRR